ncbi:hypothetical protein [Clostridium tagluense]|uniref:hypothetical protein n=1 Tax=Clostridium tagluense TaxID=360422 RepID=UPI001C0C6314|nr:hypothetical protein [Clostridium tagluense]MBU3127897.1 hypothetical protein [Clostridium tagluense]
MADKNIKNLVVCSTLNQITNYLIIEKYKPERVFNITFDEGAKKLLNKSIKIEEWDKQLTNACKDLGCDKFENIILSKTDIYSSTDTLERIKDEISDIDEPIYWHITGGQRIIALAISEFITGKKDKNRENDKVIYIEANTEKLVINGCLDENESYGTKEITLQKVLNLVGFKETEPKSTIKFKQKGVTIDTDEFKLEHSFYQELYKMIKSDSETNTEKQIIEFKDDKGKHKGSFRNLLLKSNGISNSTKGKNYEENLSERTKYVKLLFEKICGKHEKLKECKYDILKSHEIYGSYPAGYIFEKLAAHKIYDVIKNNDKIIEMQTSMKTYFDEDEKYKIHTNKSIIDELDIVLLTDTGKIINFECKSGSMDGNNAKSHNYTTYRLAGVFGMPIVLSPLYENENKKTKENFEREELKKQLEVLAAAESAELEVWAIDNIEDKLKELIK